MGIGMGISTGMGLKGNGEGRSGSLPTLYFIVFIES